MIGLRHFVAFVGLSLWASVGYAQLTVDKSIIELTAEENTALVRVSNTGEDTLYINLSLREVQNPELAEPVMVPVVDPIEAGILVHPRQIKLGPGQVRSVRVRTEQNALDVDRIYRLNVRPFLSESDDTDQATKRAGLTVLLAYDLLVIVRPRVLNPEIKVIRKDDSIALENTGNTNILLRSVEVCKPKGTECSATTAGRLYSKEVVDLKLPNQVSTGSAVVKTTQFVQFRESRIDYPAR